MSFFSKSLWTHPPHPMHFCLTHIPKILYNKSYIIVIFQPMDKTMQRLKIKFEIHLEPK